jgi:hypothetical protein
MDGPREFEEQHIESTCGSISRWSCRGYHYYGYQHGDESIEQIGYTQAVDEEHYSASQSLNHTAAYHPCGS